MCLKVDFLYRRIEAVARAASITIDEFSRACDPHVDYSTRVIGSITFASVAFILLLVGLVHDAGIIFNPT